MSERQALIAEIEASHGKADADWVDLLWVICELRAADKREAKLRAALEEIAAFTDAGAPYRNIADAANIARAALASGSEKP